jgi:hypothetical protein
MAVINIAFAPANAPLKRRADEAVLMSRVTGTPLLSRIAAARTVDIDMNVSGLSTGPFWRPVTKGGLWTPAEISRHKGLKHG